MSYQIYYPENGAINDRHAETTIQIQKGIRITKNERTGSNQIRFEGIRTPDGS